MSEADESYDGAMRRALNAEAKVRALEAEVAALKAYLADGPRRKPASPAAAPETPGTMCPPGTCGACDAIREPPAKPEARPMHCDEPYCPICDAPDPGPRDEGEEGGDGT